MVSSKFKPEHRKNLYYSKYKFRVAITIPNVHRTRYHRSYAEFISYKPQWSSTIHKNLTNLAEIERYFDFKHHPHTGTLMTRIECDKFLLYSDDPVELERSVNQIDAAGAVTYHSAIAPKEQGTIEFSRPPKYKFRNYFRQQSVDADFRKSIREFIEDQQTNGAEIKLNDSMTRWLTRQMYSKNGSGYLYESFYIEYSDDGFDTLLTLMFGEFLKPKVYRLVQRV